MIDWYSKPGIWCCAVILFSGGLVTVSGAAERPNILVILTDDLGVMDTELREEGFYETPHLKKLAERGMTFSNGYCAHPRCVPSRYAIQTGRFPCRNATNKGAPELQMRSRTLLAEAFQENGYATFFAGKWHLGKVEEDWPHHCGYDVNIGGCHAGAPGSYFFPYHINRKTGKEDKYGPMYALKDGEPDEHITERLSSETEKWIRAAVKGDKPFFAFLSHYAVHTPLEGKPEEMSYFEGKLKTEEGKAYLKKDGQTKVRRDDPRYASMIKTMDESVGRMMALLDELNITDNTVVLFTSDHGGLSNRGADSKRDVATSNLPYRAGKGHLYEGGLRVPFVVVYPPLVKAASKTDEVAVGTDIYPTTLALAGLDLFPEEHKDGVSLVPALKGEKLTRVRPLIFHSPLPRPTQTGDDAASSIRVGDLKLVKRYFPVSLELYDVSKDPCEKVNLANQKPGIVKSMRERLERNLVRWESMEPRKDWKDKTVTAPLVADLEWKSLPATKLDPATVLEKVESHMGITFARYGDREMLLDLYRPKEAKGKLPAIVCIHGGGWGKGDRRHHAHLAKALAARGYVTVSIDYRLSGEAKFPAHIHDCKAAVRWLRANAEKWGVDADRIGATGASAGGHLAALLGTSGGVAVLEGEGGNAKFSSTIQAAAPMGGQSDFLSERNRKISAEKEIWQAFLGGSQEEVPETYRLASPREHLDAADGPLLFLTGELDDPSTHGDELRADCLAFKVPAELVVISGAPHPFLTKQKYFDQAIERLDGFFATHLKAKE